MESFFQGPPFNFDMHYSELNWPKNVIDIIRFVSKDFLIMDYCEITKRHVWG